MTKPDLLIDLMKRTPQVKREGFFRRLGRRLSTSAPSHTPAPTPPAIESERRDQVGGASERLIAVNGPTVVISMVVLLVVLFCGYVLGRHITAWNHVDARSTKQLSDISRQPPEPDVLENPQNDVRADTGDHGTSEIPRTDETDESLGGVTRTNGMNYLIVESFRNKSSAVKAQVFLTERGITTTIERINKFYSVICTEGFDADDADYKSKTKAFERQIKLLGRQYRSGPTAGDTDFQTCYYGKWPLGR